jgi:membrane protease YdiL (CAAX protease family)
VRCSVVGKAEFSSSLHSGVPTVPRVQEKRKWEVLPVCRFIALIGISVGVGAIISQQFSERISDNLHVSREFVLHVIGFLTLHGFALIWAWVLLSNHDLSWAEGFGFNKRPLRSVIFGIVATVLAIPIAMIVIGGLATMLLKALGMNPEPQRTVTLVRESASRPQLVVLGIAAMLLAPVAEEIIFRGVLFRALYQRSYTAMAWIGTSFLFALIHGNVAAFFPLMFLALLFAWLYARTGNLLAPIAGHCVFNALNFWLLAAPPKWTWLEKLINQ